MQDPMLDHAAGKDSVHIPKKRSYMISDTGSHQIKILLLPGS